MKIINNENGKEVVYVQKGDMMYITHLCDYFPAALMDEFFSDIVIICEDNRNEFVRFVDPSIVQFFKELDWVIDYRVFKDLSEEEIMKICEDIAEKGNAYIKKYNESNNKAEKEEIYSKLQALAYKEDCIREFLLYKQGQIEYNLPVEPDGDEYKYVGDDRINKPKEKGIRRLVKRLFGRQ